MPTKHALIRCNITQNSVCNVSYATMNNISMLSIWKKLESQDAHALSQI